MRKFPPIPVLLVLVLFAALIAALAGCGKQSSMLTAPDTTSPAASSVKPMATPELRAAFAVQEANTPGLMRVSGVTAAAMIASRGAERTPLPTRSVARSATTCHGATASPRSGLTKEEIV